MKGRHEPKLPFYEAWAREFGEELTVFPERNVSHETSSEHLPFQSIIMTKQELLSFFKEIADASNQRVDEEREKTEAARKEIERILKEQNAYLQDQVNTNLRDIEKWSFASLVDIQATIRYQAKKDSGGNTSKEKSILLEQSRIAIDVRKNLLKARKTSDQGKTSN